MDCMAHLKRLRRPQIPENSNTICKYRYNRIDITFEMIVGNFALIIC